MTASTSPHTVLTRAVAHCALGVTVVAILLMLTACGSSATPLAKVNTAASTSTTVSTVFGAPTATTQVTASTLAPTTTESGTATIVAAALPSKLTTPTSGPVIAAPTTIDPAIDQALNDVGGLLGSNTQDLNAAAAAAANGG